MAARRAMCAQLAAPEVAAALAAVEGAAARLAAPDSPLDSGDGHAAALAASAARRLRVVVPETATLVLLEHYSLNITPCEVRAPFRSPLRPCTRPRA